MHYPLISVRKTSVWEDRCDACGRSNHPANHIIDFRGYRYDSSRFWDNTFANNVF
jgi:hypothetical protein